MPQSFKQKHLIIVFIFLLSVVGIPLNAETASDLQSKISSKNEEIKRLEEEIKKYQNSLNQTAGQARTLQNELNTLTLAKKKLETELKSTETNLSKTTTVITQLVGEINQKEVDISRKKEKIANNLRNTRDIESQSILETLLSSESFSDIANYLESLIRLSNSLRDDIALLKNAEADLVSKKVSQQDKQSELKKLKTKLSGQQIAVADTAKAKDTLLAVTKNQESAYQKILNEKMALRAQFEKELFEYESRLNINIDRDRLPTAGFAVLDWPLDKIFITQNFGKTSSSGRLYASGTHNGIDFRAPDGTEIKASLAGTVTATGNTDLKKSCYSYGKWILLKHSNGLSTLYAHLSSISVSPGQSVETGDIIGYSGRSGYATGPHLHLTVLATQGVRMLTFDSSNSTNCVGMTIPVADPKAFLDPILYLPKL